MNLSPEEAYKMLIKNEVPKQVAGCLDFGTFYAFALVPFGFNTSDSYLSGPIVDAIDKKTGRIFTYDITSDIVAYHNAKEIKIKTVFDHHVDLGGNLK